MLSSGLGPVKFKTLDAARYNIGRLVHTIITSLELELFNKLTEDKLNLVIEKAKYNLLVNCIVTFSMSVETCFYILINKYEIVDQSPNMCLCEVIDDNTGRPYIDFDIDIESRMLDIGEFISSYLLMRYNVSVKSYWKWSAHDTGINKRWHCIVPGICFENCWKECCIEMILEMNKCLGSVCVDMGVYRRNSCLRMVGQYKYVDGIHSRKLQMYKPCDISKLFITKSNGDICISRTILPVPLLISNNQNVGQLVYGKPVKLLIQDGIPEWVQIPSGLVPDKSLTVLGDYAIQRLVRISSSYCTLCNRVHDKDHSYLVIRKDIIEFRCYRKPIDSEGRPMSIIYRKP